jgi:hypothetical protein
MSWPHVLLSISAPMSEFISFWDIHLKTECVTMCAWWMYATSKQHCWTTCTTSISMIQTPPGLFFFGYRISIIFPKWRLPAYFPLVSNLFGLDRWMKLEVDEANKEVPLPRWRHSSNAISENQMLVWPLFHACILLYARPVGHPIAQNI